MPAKKKYVCVGWDLGHTAMAEDEVLWRNLIFAFFRRSMMPQMKTLKMLKVLSDEMMSLERITKGGSYTG